jgi:hypothetical protein
MINDGRTYGSVGMFTGITDRNQRLRMCGIEGGAGSMLNGTQAKKMGLIQSLTVNVTGGTQTIQVNKYIHEDLKKICDEILAIGWYKLHFSSWFRESNSLAEKGRMSRHCWGIAVDINAGRGGNPWFNTHIAPNQPELQSGASAPWSCQKSCYGGGYDKTRCIWHWEHPVVQIFLAHGWGWGGQYGDVMHFSVDRRSDKSGA